MSDLANMSDADLDAAIAKHSPAPGPDLSHMSDADLDAAIAKSAPAAEPKQNPHDLQPYLKAATSGLWNQAKDAAGGALNAAVHPIDTAKSVADYVGDVATDPVGDIQGLHRAVRNIPGVGAPLESIEGDVASVPQGFFGADADKAKKEYIDSLHADDAKHAKDHPLTDFVQKVAPTMVAAPKAILEEVALWTQDAFQKSIAEGNDPHTAMQDARNTAILMAGMHGAGAIAGKVKSAAGDAAGWIGGKAAKEAGVSPASIARYREDPAAVNDAMQYAKDPESLKNLVDDSVAPFNDQAAAAKDALSDAKAGVGDAAQAERDAYVANREGLKNTRPPEELAGALGDHLDSSLAGLSAKSGEAFDVLQQEGHSFNADDLSTAIDDGRADLEIAGVAPKIGPDAAAYDALGKFQDYVAEIGSKNDGNIAAGDVKKLIQTLDSVSKGAYSASAGELGPEAAQRLAAVRRSFDGVLKDASPAYKAKMGELAPQVSLLSDMSRVFGDQQKALTAMKAMTDVNSPRGYVVRQLVDRYDQAHGTTFGNDMGAYIEAQSKLRSPTAMQDFRQASPEFQTLDTAKQGQTAAAQNYLDAQTAAKGFNKIGPNSTENVIKSVQGGRNIEARKQLEALDSQTGGKNLRTIQDAGVAKQFTKSTTNGSRKAVIGGHIGGAIGGGAGALIGGHYGAAAGYAVGSAMGSVVGGLADTYGGVAVKTALDAGIALDKFTGENARYIQPIMAAAARGPQALAVAQYLMSQQDPKFAALHNDKK